MGGSDSGNQTSTTTTFTAGKEISFHPEGVDSELGFRDALKGHGTIAGDNVSTSNSINNNNDSRSGSRSSSLTSIQQRSILFSVLFVVLGCSAAVAFWVVGIGFLKREQDDQFAVHSARMVINIQQTFEKYIVAGLFVHQACRNSKCTRTGFREVYEYLLATGLEFQVTSFNPRTIQEEREELEKESAEFLGEFYPETSYKGIQGFEPNTTTGSPSVQNRSEQPFYYPVHFLEPVLGNEGAIDFDLYSSISRRNTINKVIDSWKPALTPRLSLVQESVEGIFGVILMHRGTKLTTDDVDAKPRDFSSMVVRIPDLIRASNDEHDESAIVFIFDSTQEDSEPEFLGGAIITNAHGDEEAHDDHGGGHSNDALGLEYKTEQSYAAVIAAHSSKRMAIEKVDIATRQWTILVIATEGTFQPKITFIVVGGSVVVVASFCLALWMYKHGKRNVKLNQMKAEAEAEKAKLILDNLIKTSRAERELNEFIAHEVRNPLSAALSACNFATSEITSETESLTGPRRVAVLEDLGIVDSSLHFVNDLLRNMLDLQRASSRQVKISLTPVDLKKDIFLTVDSLLYRRGGSYEVIVDCPDNLIVESDSLRLKQIVLNLAHNAEKFVVSGFIKIRACVIKGEVHVFVEDSGPGIPEEKHGNLFGKFQESLDQLNQGTGIGLSLCYSLTKLLGAKIWHDDSYHSGIEGCPGT